MKPIIKPQFRLTEIGAEEGYYAAVFFAPSVEDLGKLTKWQSDRLYFRPFSQTDLVERTLLDLLADKTQQSILDHEELMLACFDLEDLPALQQLMLEIASRGDQVLSIPNPASEEFFALEERATDELTLRAGVLPCEGRWGIGGVFLTLDQVRLRYQLAL